MKRIIFFFFFACLPIAAVAFGAGKSARIDTPQISCAGGSQVSRNITVCAQSDLPAGFSLQWMTCDEYAANGNQWLLSEDLRLSKASFSGNANGSRYDLDAGQCVTVNVGDFLFDAGASTNNVGNLTCGTCYVLRAFGHATSTAYRSDFTSGLTCSTLDCGGGGEACTYTFSDWRFLGPECAHGQDVQIMLDTPGWPVTTLTLGNVMYFDGALACTLGIAANGNGLIALAHQLIAAKLNEAQIGSLPPSVATCVADADALIGDLLIAPVGNDFLDPSATTALTTCLESYNTGGVGPGSCGEPDPGPDD